MTMTERQIRCRLILAAVEAIVDGRDPDAAVDAETEKMEIEVRTYFAQAEGRLRRLCGEKPQ